MLSRSAMFDSFRPPWTVDHKAPLSMGICNIVLSTYFEVKICTVITFINESIWLIDSHGRIMRDAYFRKLKTAIFFLLLNLVSVSV